MFDYHSMSQYSLLNALRTGNVFTDVLVCILLPIVLTGSVDVFKKYLYKFMLVLENLISKRKRFVRKIEFEQVTSGFAAPRFSVESDSRNEVLMKAILLKISSLNLKYDEAEVYLRRFDQEENKNLSYYEQLKRFSVKIHSAKEKWIEVIPGVFFQTQMFSADLRRNSNYGMRRPRCDPYAYDRNGMGDGEHPISKAITILTFISELEDGDKKIDEFVESAYSWYQKKLLELANQDKYVYIPVFEKNEDDERSIRSRYRSLRSEAKERNDINHKRYLLKGYKTFDSLFYPEKSQLIKLLSDFQNKTGKYGIEGVPHKMGILLHGPPGTGKSSMIKAIASFTDRNLVIVPLSCISSNQEFFDFMFRDSFEVEGLDFPVKLSLDQIIFVIEEIDCAAPIVLKRTEKKRTDHHSDQENKEFDFENIPDKVQSEIKYYIKHQALDLSGILNVLDGLIDSPGRMIIMTTNHPEKLDPALIRPGRIDKIIELTYIQAKEAMQMMIHFFNGFKPTIEQIKELESLFGRADFQITAAELQQLCIEMDIPEKVFEAMKSGKHASSRTFSSNIEQTQNV